MKPSRNFPYFAGKLSSAAESISDVVNFNEIDENHANHLRYLAIAAKSSAEAIISLLEPSNEDTNGNQD